MRDLDGTQMMATLAYGILLERPNNLKDDENRIYGNKSRDDTGITSSVLIHSALLQHFCCEDTRLQYRIVDNRWNQKSHNHTNSIAVAAAKTNAIEKIANM